MAEAKTELITQTAEQRRIFWRWFGDSKVVDEGGRPLVVYHGTDTEFDVFEISEDIGFHFGAQAAANDRISRAEMQEGRILPVYLSIQNPLRMPDLHTWGPQAVVSELIYLDIITEEQADKVEIVDRAQVSAWLAAKGYDGIVYKNQTEGVNYRPDGHPDYMDSYIALHPEQIKSATGNLGTFNPAQVRAHEHLWHPRLDSASCSAGYEVEEIEIEYDPSGGPAP
jgi:hypothetical protein